MILWGNMRLHGDEYRAVAEQVLEEAREEFERIRGVSVTQVPLEVVNVSWVIENWGRGYADPEIADIHRTEKIYKALFMIDQDDSLYDASLDWAASFRAAKWQGKIYVVEENFDPTRTTDAESTFVHELTHIFQDGFSVPQRPSTFDGDKAKGSLVEGDATLMADTFRGEGVDAIVISTVPDQKTVSIAILPVFSSDVQPSLPDTVSYLNWFPYDYGVEFVEALYDTDDGGWRAVDDAYANPPNTTEQVMHPEKYFTLEDAQPVDAPLIAGDWNLTKAERFGEYFILVMLDEWISTGDAEKAAEGWGGDNLTFYERNDEYLFTWNIAWDSKNDAQEFYSAFQAMMDKTSAVRENSYWSAYGRYISIQMNENSTLILSSDNATFVQQSFID